MSFSQIECNNNTFLHPRGAFLFGWCNEEACSCGTKYLSVFGTGKAIFIEDKPEKVKVLDAIMIKHTGKSGFEYPEKMLEKTLIIKVEIESVTGKKSSY